MPHTRKDQRGIAHLGLILVVVIVVAAVGFAGWRVMSSRKNKPASANSQAADTVAKAVADAPCTIDDKDICKFYKNWGSLSKQYQLNSTNTTEGQTATYLLEIDGDNTHTKSTGSYAYELISIGKTSYIKAPNGTWWKQAEVKTQGQDSTPTPEEPDFKAPAKDESSETADTTVYVKLGKEACGNLTCFKYQIKNSGSTDKEYIWFDDHDYKLRHSRTEQANGDVSDMLFAYDSVKVSAPTSYKELQANQYLLPGENEPTTLPSSGLIQDSGNDN